MELVPYADEHLWLTEALDDPTEAAALLDAARAAADRA